MTRCEDSLGVATLDECRGSDQEHNNPCQQYEEALGGIERPDFLSTGVDGGASSQRIATHGVHLASRRRGQQYGEVLNPDRLSDAGEDREHCRNHKKQSKNSGKPAGTVPQDRTERERQQGDERQIAGTAEEGAYNFTIQKLSFDAFAREYGHGDECCCNDGDEAHDERGDGQNQGLRKQGGQASWHGGEGGTDHAGRVLATDDEHSEHSSNELGEVHTERRDHDGEGLL